MLEKTLAQKLIEIRKKNKWNQETAAELCDISPRYWGKIERCQASASIAVLDKISKGLHISAAELLSENQTPGSRKPEDEDTE